MSQEVAFEGRIIRVEQTVKPDGRIFEKAIRPPGTRTIIFNPEKEALLLTREIRPDIGQDFRLPGGKVRDTLEQWDQVKDSPNLNSIIAQAAAKEVREEAGIEARNMEVFSVSTSGGPTVEWTLYYLVATEFGDLGHQDLEVDEQITVVWVPVKEVIQMCLTGKIQEGRSVAVILQYLHSINKI